MTYFLGESGGSYLGRGRRLGRGRLGLGVEQSSKDWVWPLEEIEIKAEQSSTRSAGEASQRRETVCTGMWSPGFAYFSSAHSCQRVEKADHTIDPGLGVCAAYPDDPLL